MTAPNNASESPGSLAGQSLGAAPCSAAELRLALPWARDVAKKIRQLKGMDSKQCERVMAGMVDGMALRTVGYPGNVELPGIRPSFDVDYERGYDVGESFARAATVMQQNDRTERQPPRRDNAPDPRQPERVAEARDS